MASVFFSRVLLSVSMFAFIVFSVFDNDLKKRITIFFNTPLLWGMSLLFFLPLISGLWSHNHDEWFGMIRIKLPLLLLPFAFAGSFGFLKKHWRRLALFFIGFVIAATFWSMANYFSDLNVVNDNYLRSQLLITPLENDHVRFSWMICIAILLAAGFWWHQKKERKKNAWMLLPAILWLVIFLHILAARTGLFSFYLILLITAIWLLIKKRNTRYVIGILFLLITLPVIAYFALPTFKNRVKYFLYDLPYFSETHYKPGMNDAVRIISIKAGWNIMNSHPVGGIGFGDILQETKKWYTVDYPQMSETDKIYPCNEGLIYGTGAGWPGFIIFFIVLMIPFFIRMRENKLPWVLLNAVIAFSFLFDIGLETQFGVFLYAFIALWWWKWLREPNWP